MGRFVLYHPKGLLLTRPCKSGVWYTVILCMPRTKIKKNPTEDLDHPPTHPSNHPSHHPHHHPYFQMSYGAGLIACASLSTTENNQTLSPSYQFTIVYFMTLFDPSARSHVWYYIGQGCVNLSNPCHFVRYSFPVAMGWDARWVYTVNWGRLFES